jgi:hypothetical protein
MYSMLNLRGKNGALQPVMPAAITGVLPVTELDAASITLMFEHHNEDYRHFIIVSTDAGGVGEIRWMDRARFESGESTDADLTGIYDGNDASQGSVQSINSIEQNGNMLIFVGDATQYYALWRGEGYTWYGELPDLPAIGFTCMEEREYDENDEDTKIIMPEGEPVKGAMSYMEAAGSQTNLSIKEDLKVMTERMITLARARLTEQYAGTRYDEGRGGFGGLFFDAFMVRYAFRLYDNSTVKLSPPILVMPSGRLYDYIRVALSAGGSIKKIDQAGWFQDQQIPADSLVYMGQEKDKPWGDHVLDDPLMAPLWISLNVMLGGIIGLFDFFSDNDYLFWNQDQTLFAPPFSYMKVKGYVPGIKYDLRGLERYEGLIKSVDIFISPASGIMNAENADMEEAAAQSFKDIPAAPVVNFQKHSKNPGWMNVLCPGSLQALISVPGKALDNITEGGEFYLVKSLKPGSRSGDGAEAEYEKFPSLDDAETMYNIRNLVNQELLEDNDASIHRFGATGTYSYNGRVHWYGIKQEYFRGFDWDFFKWESDGSGPGRYNGTDSSVPALMAGNSRVILETDIGNRGKVYALARTGGALFGSAMISYPDAAAKKITVYFQEPDDSVIDGVSVYGEKPLKKVMEFPLTEHKNLNIAYYLTPQLEPIMGVKSDAAGLTDGVFSRPLISANANELRVGETGNPLEVQYQNIIQVGNDRIVNIGANVMNVSGENFGQYPLFVLTDGGAYALATGTDEAAYTNVQHIAFGEPATNSVICQTPAGLVYVGANGLYFINGMKAELLTKAVEEAPDRLHLEYKPVMEAPLRLFVRDGDGGDFRRYIQQADNMWYDDINNELSVWRSGTTGWTICLDNGVVYRNGHLPGRAIKNTASNALRLDGANVLDMLSARTTGDDGAPLTVDVSFITRPMCYGTPDAKTLERLILRGMVYGEGVGVLGASGGVIVVWHSNDNRNFIISKGLRMKAGNYRDVDTGLYCRNKFRGYMLGFGGKVTEGTKIAMIETEIEKSYPFMR